MMDFLYSIFMAPVPAWLLWLYVGTSLVVARIWWNAYHQMSDIAEQILLQKQRDDTFGKSP